MQCLSWNNVARNDGTQARRVVVGHHHCAFPILSIQGGSFDCTQRRMDLEVLPCGARNGENGIQGLERSLL